MHPVSARNMEHVQNGYSIFRLFTVGATCFGMCPSSVHQPVLTYCVEQQPVQPVLSHFLRCLGSLLLYVHTTVRRRHDLPCIHYIPSVIQLCNTSDSSKCCNMLVTLSFPVHVFTFKIVTRNGFE